MIVFKQQETVGTLSKDNDDGSENDGTEKKLRSFKLNRVYLDPLKCRRLFPGVEFLRILFRLKKMKGNSS